MKYFMKNANHFIELTKKEKIQLGDRLVSFIVVSLFNNVLIDETLEINKIKNITPGYIM